RPLSLQFSADYRYLLGFSPIMEMQFAAVPPTSEHRVVELATGKELQIDSQVPAFFPGWAPSGSAMAYIVRDKRLNPETSGMYIVDQPGGRGKLVYPSIHI